MNRLPERRKQTRESFLSNTNGKTGWVEYLGLPLMGSSASQLSNFQQRPGQLPRNTNFGLMLNMSLVPRQMNLNKALFAATNALIEEEGSDLGFKIYLMNSPDQNTSLLDPRYPYCWDGSLASAHYGNSIDSDRRGAELIVSIPNNTEGEISLTPDEILDVMMRLWQAMIKAGVETGYVPAPVGCVAIACEEGICCPFSWSIARPPQGEFGVLFAEPNPSRLPNPFTTIEITREHLRGYQITPENVEDIVKRRREYFLTHQQEAEGRIVRKLKEVSLAKPDQQPDYYNKLAEYVFGREKRLAAKLNFVLEKELRSETCTAQDVGDIKDALKQILEYIRWCFPRQSTLRPFEFLEAIENVGQALLNYNRTNYTLFVEGHVDFKTYIVELREALEHNREEIRVLALTQTSKIFEAFQKQPTMMNWLVEKGYIKAASAEVDLQKLIWADPTAMQEVFIQLRFHLGEQNPPRPVVEVLNPELIRRVALPAPVEEAEDLVLTTDAQQPARSWSIESLFACFRNCMPNRQADYAPVALQSVSDSRPSSNTLEP